MKEIAVLIPCYNEALTVGKVVDDFKKELPQAKIYVYDNNSKDDTYAIAKQHGAIVRYEPNQGKGNVVRSMFREIEADYYVLVDGDDTYPAEDVHAMLEEMVKYNADMIVGDRLSNGTYGSENKRNFHGFGNNLVRSLINRLFKGNVTDIMTGYRIFSKRFVKVFPLMSNGFEIETEMTIFALANKCKIRSVDITYRDRPEGSFSKLNTFSDGFKVLLTIFNLLKAYKPLLFFSLVGLAFVVFGVIVGIPVIVEFNLTHFVSKLPSAVLAASLMVIAVLLVVTGLILDYCKNMNQNIIQIHLNKYPLEGER